MQVWRDDGVPTNVPLFITESNISWQSSESSVDIFGALWLADYVGSFLAAGGDASTTSTTFRWECTRLQQLRWNLWDVCSWHGSADHSASRSILRKPVD